MKQAVGVMLIFLLVLISFNEVRGYEVSVAETKLPKAVGEAMRNLVSPQTVQFMGKENKRLCQFWLHQGIEVLKIQESRAGILLPMIPPGTFVGIAEYFEVGEACHDQPIPRGVYTMRYMQIPQDGNHIGTYPTNDFILLLPVDKDLSPELRPTKELLDAAISVDLHPYTLPLTIERPDKMSDLPAALLDKENRPTLFAHWMFRSKQQGQTMPLVIGFIPGFGLVEPLGVF